MAQKAFVYDPPRPQLTRLFKLDLNEPGQPLSGQILSFVNFDIASDHRDLRASWKALRENERLILPALGDGQNYDALSYTWGPPGGEQPLALRPIASRMSADNQVVLDHEPHRAGVVWIRKSLYEFLQEFRRQGIGRFLWVDAICINQGDDEDKSSQMPSMRVIYENATRVYAWLGMGESIGESPLDRLAGMTATILSNSWERKHPEAPYASDPSDLGLPPPDAKVWSDLRTFFTLPWWSRLWTLQEAVMAQDYDEKKPREMIFMYGSRKTSWATIRDFAVAVERFQLDDFIISGIVGGVVEDKQAFDAIQEIQTCRQSINDQGFAVRLNAVLLATRRRRSTIPVDMVVGQCALLDAAAVRDLKLNTDQPADIIFVNFGKYYLRQEPTECLLNHVCTEERHPDLPSWCPNFASPPETMSLGSRSLDGLEHSKFEGGERYHAGFDQDSFRYSIPHTKLWVAKIGLNALRLRNAYHNYFETNNPRRVQLIDGTNAIRLSGFDLGEVTDYVDCNSGAESSKFLAFNSIEQTSAWDKCCLALAQRILAPQIRDGDCNGYDVYARTLAANRVLPGPAETPPNLFDRDGTKDFAKAYFGFRRFMEATLAAGEAIAQDNLDPEDWRFASVMHRVMRRRRFFATRGGRIGVGPSTAAPGDRLCVVWFCPTPYLLRATGDGNFQLVGECYVHGLMYAEAVQMFDRKEIRETTWVVE